MRTESIPLPDGSTVMVSALTPTDWIELSAIRWEAERIRLLADLKDAGVPSADTLAALRAHAETRHELNPLFRWGATLEGMHLVFARALAQHAEKVGADANTLARFAVASIGSDRSAYSALRLLGVDIETPDRPTLAPASAT